MSNAGYAAKRMARKYAWQANPVRIYGPTLAALAVVSALVLVAGVKPLAVFVAAVTIAAVEVGLLWRKNAAMIRESKALALRWWRGYLAEKATARLLRRVRRMYLVLHDRWVESIKSNLDHLAFSRYGLAFHIDTKNSLWLHEDHDSRTLTVMYGTNPFDPTSTNRETKALQAALNRHLGSEAMTVETLVVARHWNFPAKVWRMDGVLMMPASELPGYLKYRHKQAKNADLQTMTDREFHNFREFIEKKFPRA